MKKKISIALAALAAAGMMAGCAAETETSYVYGTARLTWAEFWEGEKVTYDKSLDFDAVNAELDTEGVADLGGYDTVTRATSKHGAHRGSAHYANLLHAVDGDGNAVSVYLHDLTDGDEVGDMFGVGSILYGLSDGSYSLAERDGATAYTITGVEVTGYRAWPVKVPENQVEAAAEAIGFVADDSVTEETGRLKTVNITRKGVEVSSAADSAGMPVDFGGEITVSYDDKYGDYLFVQLANCPEDWGRNMLGARYAYFGEVNPNEDLTAEPIATYGTKYAADTWWKANGTLLQFGMNTSHRHGGGEQYGYWQITIMADGYEDHTVTVLALPRYISEITATLAEDNATLTIGGIEEADWEKTIVTFDGVEVDMNNGIAVLAEQEIGAHTVIVSVGGYREYTLEAIAMSDLTASDITLEDNVLKVNGDLENYLTNITGIAVGETTISGEDLGHAVFNADGSVNFGAEIASKRGSTVVFPNGDAESYTLIITAAGYPNVVLATEAAG